MNTGPTTFLWRGAFANDKINALHAQAFGTRTFTDDEWDWNALVGSHSLGWVVARRGDVLVGFVNVVWDGFVHAWLQDTMVSATSAAVGSVRSWSLQLGTRPAEPGANTCMSTSSRI